MLNSWLIGSLFLLGIWFIIYFAKSSLRREMFWVSLFTMPFGLLEPLFVPEYWNPPSLFNLAATTGFDIESCIFMFAFGGIGSTAYEIFFKQRFKKIKKYKLYHARHVFHKFNVLAPFLVFFLLYFLTELNVIYSASIGMFVGGIATMICRPDLKKQILISGVLFMVLYFLFFFLFVHLLFPGFVQELWNLEAVSGILILGMPLEELMFGFTFGMMWSVLYEHVKGYKLKKS